ncbi:MAG: hypothetical protein R3321_05870, partial [Nitrososphaeraceae archaeon]|nr:hypothetical protein [Nitrososphaeraceae archaeon]
MRKQISHICDLLRDIFHIEKRPVPITIEQKPSINKSTLPIIIGWCLFTFIVSNILLNVDKLALPILSNDQTSSINLSQKQKTEISQTGIRLDINNITILKVEKDNFDGFVEVIWTKNSTSLYEEHKLTDTQRFI